MKKILLNLLVFTSLTCFAQTNVSLTLEHHLNGEPFEWALTGTNNLDLEFNFGRLQYYMSSFSVTHDGGVETSVDDLYALVVGNESPTINLGAIDAQNLEMISFYIGVDEANNHSDPSAWPADHPLEPTFPSMHWGWVAGYRFIAIEGDISATLQEYSIHGLGDVNYFRVDLEVNIELDGDELIIPIIVSTENILFNMNLDETVFSHGEEGFARQALENMSEYVFAISTAPLSVNDENEFLEFNVFPNPTDNGSVQFNFTGDAGDIYNLVVRDIQGKTVIQRNQVNSGYQLDVNGLNEGLYLVSLYDNANLRGVKKLVVRKN